MRYFLLVKKSALLGLSIALFLSFSGCGSNGDGFLGAGTSGAGPGPGSGPGPINASPVANAGADQNVIVGATVMLDGSASHDQEGNTLSYSWAFESCPSSVCPALAGPTTAAPSFVPDRAGIYVVRLTVSDGQSSSPIDTMSVTVSPATPSDPGFLLRQWQYGIFGTNIGRAGLLVSDLDGDGIPEIVVSASSGDFSNNDIWYILRHAADGSYEQIWRSMKSASLARLVTTDTNGDGHDDIIVGLSDGTVEIYDGPTRVKLKSISVAAPLTALAIADIDQNGTKEIVTSNGIGVFVYASGSGELIWSIPSGGGNSLAVGNVDADAALEIVTTTSGGKGYVIDGGSHVVEWEYANSFGARVELGDLDGDGLQEIVGAFSWSKITIFDGDSKTLAWEIPTSLDIETLLVADAEADGIPEIIYGDGQWGSIHAVDARTHAEKWSMHNPEHGVSGIAVGDADQDGKKEVLWGAGGTSSGADHLYVAEPGRLKWQSKDLGGPLCAVSIGDVDDDGEDEIVMVSAESDSGYAEGIISIFNARTHVLEYQEKLGINDWMGVRSVRIGDVDNDGRTEFAVTTGHLYDGVIRVYDGASHTQKSQSAGYSGNFFSALAIGDVDGDGKTEIVAGQGKESTGATGAYLIVFDGSTLAEKWRSADSGNSGDGVYDIKLADLKGDGHTEIIASLTGSRLIVYDGVTHELQLSIDRPFRALEVADIDHDGALEILAGRNDGKIDVFNGSTFGIKKTVSTFETAPINALRVVDLDGNGTSDWLLTRGNMLVILDGQDQGLKWISGSLSGSAGFYNQLGIKDIDGDGKLDVVLGSDLAIYQFE